MTARPEVPTVPHLTSKDSAILSALFDYESLPSTTILISDPAHAHPNVLQLAALRSREVQAIRLINIQDPPLAAIESSIEELSNLIETNPNYASAYLNRAQATRLLLDSNPLFFTSQNLSLTTQLFSDLSTVITLTTRSPLSSSTPISSLEAELLANAHTHRGYLLLKAASSTSPILPETFKGFESAELVELSSHDFTLGGRYGNKIAKQLSVQTNPYAKACGAIVKEALKKEREEYGLFEA